MKIKCNEGDKATGEKKRNKCSTHLQKLVFREREREEIDENKMQ